jgi:hypothetical protein
MDPRNRLEHENRVLKEGIKGLSQFSKGLLARIEVQDVEMLRLKELLDQIIKKIEGFR